PEEREHPHGALAREATPTQTPEDRVGEGDRDGHLTGRELRLDALVELGREAMKRLEQDRVLEERAVLVRVGIRARVALDVERLEPALDARDQALEQVRIVALGLGDARVEPIALVAEGVHERGARDEREELA